MLDLWKKIRVILTQGMLATVASQCGGDDNQIFVPGDPDATLNMSVTDAPVDFAGEVWVEFTGIELTPSSGDTVTLNFSSAQAVNLLALANGATSALLSNQAIDAGTYTAIRFIINASATTNPTTFVEEMDGNQYPLVVRTDDDESGLTITKSFTVEPDGRLDLIADFDLRRSIVPRAGSSTYTFRPVVRVVERTQAGAISGSVDVDLANPTNCTPFVYLYSGSSVVPDDMDATVGSDPVISVPVTFNVPANKYTYRASFLEAGDYTVAYTCDGGIDNPDTDEGLVFLPTQNVTLTATPTMTIDFTS